MESIKKILVTLLVCIISILGCAACGKNVKQTEIQINATEKEQTYPTVVDDLGIKKYQYGQDFSVDKNLQILIENMLVYYSHFDSNEYMNAHSEEEFIHNICQNSWCCFDYLYDSLDRSNGLISKQEIEYIQYSFSGKYVDFQSLSDDDYVDINDCSSGFVYAELQSYEYEADDNRIYLNAKFDLSDGSQRTADIILIKNEYSCFDGYSVEKFQAND